VHWRPQLIGDDLAPGDRRALASDWRGIEVVSIRSASHPLFAPVYDRLWAEFGSRGEMERRDVIEARFGWDPRRPIDQHALQYEMLAVLRDGQLLAVRDHSVVVPGAAQGPAHPVEAIVHLSHVLVEPALRGSGLAAWLRALPLQTARACAAAAGHAGARFTLVAEMEHDDGVTPAVTTRLRSYARAGFRALEPNAVRYLQPDFRAADIIAATAPQPLPLALLLRRVGREHEDHLLGAEVREIIAALYTMFGVHVRADHMAPLWTALERLPGANARVPLRPPTDT
jgi:GNAT superfamily N-acetyltransferase